MATLQSKIQELASDFASGVLEAVRASSFEELAAAGHGRAAGSADKAPKQARTGGRLARRSEEDIAGVVDRIIALLKSKPNGLRAEQLREELSLEAKELPRPLADALASRQIKKSGNKRATTYFAAAGKTASKPKKKAAAKPAKKKPVVKAKAKSKSKSTKKAKAKPAKKAAAPATATNGVAASG